MHAWIVISLFVAWPGDAPSLNLPRPQVVKLPPQGVTLPAMLFPSEIPQPPQPESTILILGYSKEEEDAEESVLVPPAPLPQLKRRNSRVILAAHPAEPESCQDSDENPPAPPAETGTCKSKTLIGITCGQEIGLFSNEVGTELFPQQLGVKVFGTPGSVNLVGCGLESPQQLGVKAFGTVHSEPQPIPDVTPKEKLQHIQSAIQHLEAAGLHDAAQQLQEQCRIVAAQLHQEQQRLLREKQAELRRLTTEIEHLKADLANHASIEFRLEHFVVNADLLKQALFGDEAELRTAARVLSSGMNPTLRSAAHIIPAIKARVESDMSLATALELLRKNGVIQLRSAPKLVTHSGETVHLVVGNALESGQSQDGNRGSSRTNFAVHAPAILPDGRIHAEVNYEMASDRRVAEAAEKTGSAYEATTKIAGQITLTPGQPTVLGGRSIHGTTATPAGATSHRRTEVLVITALLREGDADPSIPSDVPSADWINSAENDDCEPESSPIQPSSNTTPAESHIPWWSVPFLPSPEAAINGQEIPVQVLQEMPVFRLIPSPGTGSQMRLLVPVSPRQPRAIAPAAVEPSESDESSPAAPLPDRTEANDEESPPIA